MVHTARFAISAMNPIGTIKYHLSNSTDGIVDAILSTDDDQENSTNPFENFRFSDEDIAIATCLVKMNEYVKNGIEFYSSNEAYIDYSMMI